MKMRCETVIEMTRMEERDEDVGERKLMLKKEKDGGEIRMRCETVIEMTRMEERDEDGGERR